MAWLAAGALAISAASGAYSAYQSGQNAKKANQTAREANEINRESAQQNAIIDGINNLRNARQQAIDNGRYDEAYAAEQAQRRLTNSLATASLRDTEGNTVSYDPATGQWSTISTGQGATDQARRRQLEGEGYRRSLVGQNVDQTFDRTRATDTAQGQSRERALAQALLAQYANNPGRSPQQMEGALIEKNVAESMDPLRRAGENTMLAGYRQGNSGSDALMGALARQGQGATRSAIAGARYSAPTDSFSDRDLAAKSVLGPATTLANRGNATIPVAAPTYSGDTSGNLLASVARANPASLATGLNPRTGQQAVVGQRQANLSGFQPLNANGTIATGLAESARAFANSPELRNLLKGNSSLADPYINAPDYNTRGYGATNASADGFLF